MFTITIPVHPDEQHVPLSVINLPLPSGSYVHLQMPLAPKTMEAMIGTLEACRECIVAKPAEDYSI